MNRFAPPLVCALVQAIGLTNGSAQDAVSREYEIKVAYLYFFPQYVKWPKNAVPGDENSFVIGVLGPNVFGKHLDRLATATINNKQVVVNHFPAATDYKPCHMLFISPDDMAEKRLAQALEKCKNSPVLLVGETAGFARKGVVINFFITDNKVHFEINPDAAKRADLEIKAQLMGIPNAKVIKNAGGGN